MRFSSIRALPISVVLALIAPALVMFAFPAQAATQSVVTHTVAVGTQPLAIAITPDGQTGLVANYGANTVSIFDVASGSVMHTVSVGPRPSDIEISPDGQTAYVVVYGDGIDTSLSAVHWLDISTGAISRTLRSGSGLGSYPSALVMSDDGQYLYVYPTTPVTPFVAKVQTSTGAIFTPVYTAFVGSFGSAIKEVVISPDGQRLAVVPLLAAPGVDIVDTNTMNRDQVIPLNIGNGSATYSSDGSELYVSDPARDEIAVVNTTSYNVVRWSSGGDDPRGLTASDSGALFVSNVTGDSLASLTSGSVTGSAAVVNPQRPVLTDVQDRVLVPSRSGNALAIITASSMSLELVPVGSLPNSVATARGYAVVSNSGSNTVSMIRLGSLPASGDQVPSAPLQQFGRMASQDCTAAIPDSVLFPGVGEDQRRDSWGMSWAQWPNGGTGGFVCTRQPYFTNTGQWSVG